MKYNCFIFCNDREHKNVYFFQMTEDGNGSLHLYYVTVKTAVDPNNKTKSNAIHIRVSKLRILI